MLRPVTAITTITNLYTLKIPPLIIFKEIQMTPFFNRLTLGTALVFGQSAAQAHSADGTVASVFHLISAPDHLGVVVFAVLLVCSLGSRLLERKRARAVKINAED